MSISHTPKDPVLEIVKIESFSKALKFGKNFVRSLYFYGGKRKKVDENDMIGEIETFCEDYLQCETQNHLYKTYCKHVELLNEMFQAKGEITYDLWEKLVGILQENYGQRLDKINKNDENYSVDKSDTARQRSNIPTQDGESQIITLEYEVQNQGCDENSKDFINDKHYNWWVKQIRLAQKILNSRNKTDTKYLEGQILFEILIFNIKECLLLNQNEIMVKYDNCCDKHIVHLYSEGKNLKDCAPDLAADDECDKLLTWEAPIEDDKIGEPHCENIIEDEEVPQSENLNNDLSQEDQNLLKLIVKEKLESHDKNDMLPKSDLKLNKTRHSCCDIDVNDMLFPLDDKPNDKKLIDNYAKEGEIVDKIDIFEDEGIADKHNHHDDYNYDNNNKNKDNNDSTVVRHEHFHVHGLTNVDTSQWKSYSPKTRKEFEELHVAIVSNQFKSFRN